MIKWENIDAYHRRFAIPGGWLVKAYEDVSHTNMEYPNLQCGHDWRIAMCFVPDPEHAWVLPKE